MAVWQCIKKGKDFSEKIVFKFGFESWCCTLVIQSFNTVYYLKRERKYTPLKRNLQLRFSVQFLTIPANSGWCLLTYCRKSDCPPAIFHLYLHSHAEDGTRWWLALDGRRHLPLFPTALHLLISSLTETDAIVAIFFAISVKQTVPSLLQIGKTTLNYRNMLWTFPESKRSCFANRCRSLDLDATCPSASIVVTGPCVCAL